MLFGLGMILLMLGVSMADSKSLVIPMAVITIGLVLMCIGSRTEGRDETE